MATDQVCPISDVCHQVISSAEGAREGLSDATDDKKCVGRERTDTWQQEGRKCRHFNGDYLGTKPPPNHLPEIQYVLFHNVKVKQSRYKPRVAQRVQGN